MHGLVSKAIKYPESKRGTSDQNGETSRTGQDGGLRNGVETVLKHE